ncbi:MAG: type II toxin-antitoxin system RelE/ParE family toxin [Elusimicrobia bacterium]|nr:type II toxin-antitoxin system RelE/ParE family toxin [Elusimicrobiota bacterium]
MKSRFLLLAEIEMLNAAKFYEGQAHRLGVDFLDRVQMAVEDVESNPLRWPPYRRNIRRRLVSRFPYAVLYRVDPKNVVIVAVMHLHRNPNCWIGRA